MIDALEAVGRAAGLDAVGVAPATPFERTRADLAPLGHDTPVMGTWREATVVAESGEGEGSCPAM